VGHLILCLLHSYEHLIQTTSVIFAIAEAAFQIAKRVMGVKALECYDMIKYNFSLSLSNMLCFVLLNPTA